MLTLDAVSEVLDRLAAESGDTQFENQSEGCYYRKEDGEPLCIVGHVLAELEPESFQKINTNANGNNGTIIGSLVHYPELELEAEQDALWLLEYVQREQDDQKSWATAVLEGRHKLDLVLRARANEH